jgi:hypothetical protein
LRRGACADVNCASQNHDAPLELRRIELRRKLGSSDLEWNDDHQLGNNNLSSTLSVTPQSAPRRVRSSALRRAGTS